MIRLKARAMSREEGAELLDAIFRAVDRADLTIGQTLRFLRAEYLGKTQAAFAKMVALSPRVLSQMETDRANPTFHTVNQAFSPFGYRAGLVPKLGRRSARVENLSEERYQDVLEAIQNVLRLNPRAR